MTYQQEANNVYVDGVPVDKNAIHLLWAMLDDSLARSAKAFYGRASAVDFGQAKLPTQLGLITTVEGDWIVSRAPGLFDDDPLFAPNHATAPTNGPWWGARSRVPTKDLYSYSLSVLGVIPLGSIGGTANAITASYVQAGTRSQLIAHAGSTYSFITPTTNGPGGVTLAIAEDVGSDGVTPVVRRLLTADGDELPADYIVPFRTNTIQRRGNDFRLIGGSFDRVDFDAVVRPTDTEATMVPVITSGSKVAVWLENGNLAAKGMAPILQEQATQLIAPTVDASDPDLIPVITAGQKVLMWIENGELNWVGKTDPAPASTVEFTYSDNASLHRWRTALGKVTMGLPGAKAKIALIGDSWFEQAIIPRALFLKLEEMYGTTGEGFRSGTPNFNFNPESTWVSQGWTIIDGSNASSFPYGAGPDGNSVNTTGNAAFMEYTNFRATDIRLVFRHFGGKFQYSVDGGAMIPVVCDSSGTRDFIDISGLADGLHSLRIETTNNDGGGRVVFDYVYTTRTPVTGVQILKFGNGGTTARRVSNYAQYLTQPMLEMQPDVTVVLLGTNDYRDVNSSPETYIKGLQDIVTATRAAIPDMGFVFLLPSQSQGPAVIPLESYRNALWNWAKPRGHQVISLLDRWPDFPTANAAGLWRDHAHISDPLGANLIVNSLLDLSLKG